MGSELTYFSLLGISEDASQEELEARYREVAEYLASPALPAHLREWATRQAAPIFIRIFVTPGLCTRCFFPPALFQEGVIASRVSPVSRDIYL